jgi:hypothetical protein
MDPIWRNRTGIARAAGTQRKWRSLFPAKPGKRRETMAKNRTPAPDESRLEKLDDDIEKAREREKRRREEEAKDHMRFATPEAYEGKILEEEERANEPKPVTGAKKEEAVGKGAQRK